MNRLLIALMALFLANAANAQYSPNVPPALNMGDAIGTDWGTYSLSPNVGYPGYASGKYCITTTQGGTACLTNGTNSGQTTFTLPATGGTLSTGSGTVNLGTAGQIAYYATSTNAVSGETLIAASNMPALTGDVTSTAGTATTTVAKINGAALGSVTPTAAYVLIGNGTQWVSNPVTGTCSLTSTGVMSCPGAITNVDNFLPNPQWQLASGIQWGTKQLSSGTGPQTSVSCTGFTLTTETPVFTCSNTQQLKVGDLVVISNDVSFWGWAGPGYVTCSQVQCTLGYVTSARVIGLVANTSVTLQGPIGANSPGTSIAVTLQPIAPYDGSTGRSMDGWSKSSTLIISPDDFPANAYPGSIRTLLLRKGVTGSETTNVAYTANSTTLGSGSGTGNTGQFLLGTTVTCEFAVWQKVQGGAGTWQIFIYDNVNGSRTSANGTGSSYGGYQVLSVTAPIASTATTISMGLNTLGNAGDVYYLAGPPTCAIAPSLVPSQMHMNSNTLVRATSHWNPPILTPMLLQFGTSTCGGLYCLYGPNNGAVDLEAISFGTFHNTLNRVWAKMELTTPTVGAMIFTTSSLATFTFGPQCSAQVANVMFPCWGTIPIYLDGTFIMTTNTSGFTPTTNTFDFWDASNEQINYVN